MWLELFFVVWVTVILIGIFFDIRKRRMERKIFYGQIILMIDKEGNKTFTLELEKDPFELKDSDLVLFRVKEEV